MLLFMCLRKVLERAVHQFIQNISLFCLYCIGFMWQGFGSGETAEVASVRRHQGLSPCRAEPLSAGSKVDLLLAKAMPISNTGGTSAIAYLRKGKKGCVAAVREECENVRETTLQSPRSVQKEGEEVLQAPEQSPCSPCRRPW